MTGGYFFRFMLKSTSPPFFLTNRRFPRIAGAARAGGIMQRKMSPKERQEKIRSERVRRMFGLYQSGLTLEQIGQFFGGISRERVRQIFEAAGFARRSLEVYQVDLTCLLHGSGRYGDDVHMIYRIIVYVNVFC